MVNSKTVQTWILSSIKVTKTGGKPFANYSSLYGQIIGALNYQFMYNPSDDHWSTVKLNLH